MPTKPKDKTRATNDQVRSALTPGQQARVARKEQVRATAARRRRRERLTRWGAGVLLVAAVVGGATWLARRGADDTGSGLGGLPGPRGGENVAQDVNTLVGMPAPAFTLADSEGTSYAITPGQGRPVVLVFHMGIT